MAQRILLACLLLAWPLAQPRAAAADRVTPTERVRSNVVVRAQPRAGSPALGSLAKGEELPLAEGAESAEGWRPVAFGEERVGYVSARWTRVVAEEPPPEVAHVPDPPPVPDELLPAPRPGFAERMAHTLARAFGRSAPVEIEITQPPASRTHLRHPEPRVPISGFAAGPGGILELVLAIDASTSANEFAEADVDGDGVLEDDWAGDDSIYQAQVMAARHLVAALQKLPGNAQGERVRVGVIRFAGDERYREHPDDADFDPTPVSILALAQRDAVRAVGLTHDYAAVDAALVEMARERPKGMTNLAAAIGLGVMELSGLADSDASQPREGAGRVLNVLTDGMPSLPYDREPAERAARAAASLAREQGIRVNVFELGRNAVTRRKSETGERIASISGGSLTVVDRPGDILEELAATSLTFVDRMRLTNRTTDQRTRYVSTGLDGSFYGEVPLQEGENEIDVVAILHDGRERAARVTVIYHPGDTTPELEKQLTLVRERNEALIEEIRKKLALEMEREKQRKQLDVGAGPEANADGE